MKLLLTFLPTMQEIIEDINSAYPTASIYLLKELINKAGYSVNTIDSMEYIFVAREWNNTGNDTDKIIENISKFLNSFLEEGINILAFSCNTFNWGITKKVIGAIRRYGYRGNIILGGIHPTYFYKHIFNTCDVDFIILGDGEVAIIELIKAIEKQEKIVPLNNVASKENFEDKLINPAFISKKQLENNPIPNYEDIRVDYKYKYIPVESSRGCYNRCAFCSIQSKAKWREIDPEVVVNNACYAIKKNGKKFSNKYILFTDDCFTSDVDRALRIINYLVRVNQGYKYFIEARVRDLINGHFIENVDTKMILGIQIGIECGYNEGLKKIRKGTTVESLIEACEILKKGNLTEKCMLSFIIGFPWETKKEINKTLDTIKFISENYNIYCNINYFLLLPSELWEKRKDYDLWLDESFFDKIDCFTNIENFYLTHPLLTKEVLKDVKERVERFQKKGFNVILQNDYL